MHAGERLNSITHLVGAMLSVAGLVSLVTLAALDHDAYKVVSFAVYGAMLCALYTISTLYHGVRGMRWVLGTLVRRKYHGNFRSDGRTIHFNLSPRVAAVAQSPLKFGS